MHRNQVRLQIARAEVPGVLLATGILIIIISAATFLQEAEPRAIVHIIDVLSALVLISLAAVSRWTRIPSAAVPWIAVAGVVLLHAAFLYEVHLAPDPVIFAYLVIMMTAVGPVALAWRPFLVGAAIMLCGVIVLTITWSDPRGVDWLTVSVTSLLVSALLLLTRLRSIYRLADAQDLAERLATTDELTGLLNRHGLQAQLTRMQSMARRMELGLFAVFVDIDGLKAANDRHGHGFGDEVIDAAAAAVLASVRAGDLVARWGGDEIVVIGIGEHPDPTAFAVRLDHNVTASRIDRDRWPGHLSVGFADADPDSTDVDVDELIGRADFDMYGRRKAQ
jgi:diguanylate cyclase (GGDEF)-like protein